jgi:two-component system, OmpR family, response regulator
MNILIVEDDSDLSKNIKVALSAEGHKANCVYDGILGERAMKSNTYDCIILDINLPGKNGFELCKNYRNYNKTTPVIMLTAFGELDDKVTGFENGADDYLTKPFFMRELILRVNSLLKRRVHISEGEMNTSVHIAGDIIINDSLKKVFRQEVEIELTPREYQILFTLIRRKGEIVAKNDLLKEIWGTINANTNTIEVYINILRNKIDKPFGKNSIKTKVGYGYYLDV